MSTTYNDVIIEYSNTGTTRYAITFEYDRPEQVYVRYYSKTEYEYVYVTNWTFDGETAIIFDSILDVPANFQILRQTNISQSFGESKFARFVQGGAIRASDLNGDLELVRQAIEEGLNNDGLLQDQIDDLTDNINNIDLDQIKAEDKITEAQILIRLKLKIRLLKRSRMKVQKPVMVRSLLRRLQQLVSIPSFKQKPHFVLTMR